MHARTFSQITVIITISRLFSENPEYTSKFKHLQTIPADQLPCHTALTAHSLSILYVLHSLIDSMDDEATMKELIRKVIGVWYYMYTISSILALRQFSTEVPAAPIDRVSVLEENTYILALEV